MDEFPVTHRLRKELIRMRVHQAKECTSDAEVIDVAIRTMEAMTRAYTALVTMAENVAGSHVGGPGNTSESGGEMVT